MPVESKHKLYKQKEGDWTMIDDLLQGESAIKASGETYCPKLSGQGANEYKEYIGRGAFYNAFARTVTGLTGAVMRKDPTVNVPDEINEMMKDVTLTGRTITEFIKSVVHAMIAFAGLGIMVDYDETAKRPYMAFYGCRDVINWRYDKEGKLDLLVLKEIDEKPVDEYTTQELEQIRVYRKDKGSVIVQLWQKTSREKSFKKVDEKPLSVLGRTIQEIPFVYIGEDIGGINPGKPPLYDLARLNVKHWQVTVDYYHGLHYCALPTPWAAGWPKAAELYIGAKKAWVTENENAKCGFLEFSGEGLGAVVTAIDKLEKQMAVMGSRLLEEQKMAVEAAQAIELRQSGDLANLSSIVSTVESGMKKALVYFALWLNKAGAEAEVSINRDFISERLTPEQIIALLQTLQQGYISQDTFLYNLQSGEILPPGRTIEEEKKLIAAEAPPPGRNGGGEAPFNLGEAGQA